MPTNKDIASEIWLHVNSPETIDKIVGESISKLQREARLDDLSEYQNERKEIDDAVERYMDSPTFENYKQKFLDIDDRDSPELEKAVGQMSFEMRHGRDDVMKQLSEDFSSLTQAIEQDQNRDAQEPEL